MTSQIVGDYIEAEHVILKLCPALECQCSFCAYFTLRSGKQLNNTYTFQAQPF
jgi:hypothetical protein